MKLVRKILVAMLLGTMAIQVVWADINEDFLEAASKCDLDKVKQLLRLGADVNVDNGKAFIGTSNCSVEKSIKIMEYLISQGLDINAKGENGTILDDALVLASLRPIDYNLIKYLVSKGADVNVRVSETSNRFLDTIMNYYPNFLQGELDIIEYIISKGAFVGIDDLRRFLYKFSLGFNKKPDRDKANKVLKLFIKSVKNLNECNHRGEQSLEDILLRLHGEEEYEAIDLLLENGFDVNSKCRYGITMLMNTCNVNLVKYLISKGADVNIRDDKGETALTKALNNKCYNVAELLVSKGAKK